MLVLVMFGLEGLRP